MPHTPPSIEPAPVRRNLAVLLAVSALLRIGLALQGGQFFFGDEQRYERGVAMYQALRTGDAAGLREQLRWPEHAAFNYVTTGVAALQHGLAHFTGHGDWSQPQNIYASASLAAAVLSLFSVLNLWLVHRLARAAGAGEDEAWWAAFLAAGSNTLFYCSRHLLPYDCALSAALGGVLFAVSGTTRRRQLLSGGLAALTFALYNGYWFLVPVVLLALVVSPGAGSPGRALGWWVAGFGAALAGLLAPGAFAGGAFFWRQMAAFSQTVRQGLFAEGWSLGGEYLGHSEGWLAVLVVAVAMVGVWQTRLADSDSRRVRRWLLLLAAAWLLPVLASTGLHKFVVYARTVRPLVPLCCLVAALGWAALQRAHPRLGPWLQFLVAGTALVSFAPHFARVFPRDVELGVLSSVGVTKHTVSFSGTIYRPLALPVNHPDLVLVNAALLNPVRDYLGYPAGKVVLSFAHPLDYLPYQYEGHTPRERALLRQHPPRIALIRLDRPADLPDRPPAALLFGDSDRPDGFDHAARP